MKHRQVALLCCAYTHIFSSYKRQRADLAAERTDGCPFTKHKLTLGQIAASRANIFFRIYLGQYLDTCLFFSACGG